jgi:hypothetical protein
MISDDLANLSDWCVGQAARGIALHTDRLAHLAKVLLDLSHQVHRLELLPIDTAQLVKLDDPDDD